MTDDMIDSDGDSHRDADATREASSPDTEVSSDHLNSQHIESDFCDRSADQSPVEESDAPSGLVSKRAKIGEVLLTTDLTVADFERLGVHPCETRHVVIRRAALRSTQRIAKRLLNQPGSPAGTKKLTKIALSTYRLLDPRQRPDASQRAHIGRIRPNQLQMASRTEFAADDDTNEEIEIPEPSENLLSSVASLSLNIDQGDIEAGMIEAGEIDPRQLVFENQPVARSTRRPSVARNRMPLIALLSTLLIASGSVLGWMLYRNHFQPDQDAFVVHAAPPRAVREEIGRDEISATTPAKKKLEIRVDPVAAVEIAGQATAVRSKEFSDWISHAAADMAVNLEQAIEDYRDRFLVEPLSAKESDTPDPSTVASANPAIVVPARTNPMGGRDVSPHRPKSESPESDSPQADIAEPDMLEEVLRYLSTEGAGLGESVHRRLALDGLRLHEQLLCSESFDQAARVSQHTRQHCVAAGEEALLERIDLEQRDAEKMTDLFEKVKDIQENETPETARSSDAGILGRYLCLYRRKWASGAVWLARGSDRRLASLAEKDSLLTPSTSAEQCVELASQWESAAKRMSGREAESLQLRAIELYGRSLHLKNSGGVSASHALTELQKLDVRKVRKRLLQSLAEHLHPVEPQFESSSPPARQSETTNNATPRNPSMPSSGARGLMAGWIESEAAKNDSDSIALAFEYTPGAAITDQHWNQIRRRLSEIDGRLTLQLHGVVNVDQDAKLEWMTTAMTDNQDQSIWLDGNQLEIPASTTAFVHEVKAGKHTIRWQVTAMDIRRVAFALRDATTGRPVTIEPDQTKNTPAARGKISLIAAP